MVQADGRTLMGVPQPPHGHCDELALRAIIACTRGYWEHLGIRAPNEVICFVLRPRDGQCMRCAV